MPGTTRRAEVSYSTGRLVGTVGRTHEHHHVWRGDATLTVTTRLEGDAEGRLEVRVPAGRGQLTRDGAPAGEVDLDPGSASRVELP